MPAYFTSSHDCRSLDQVRVTLRASATAANGRCDLMGNDSGLDGIHTPHTLSYERRKQRIFAPLQVPPITGHGKL